MRKHLRLAIAADEPPPPLPDLATAPPPPLSVYALSVSPRSPRGHPTWDGASMAAFADGRWMPAVWREYNGEPHPGDSVRTAFCFAGYADVLADIACDPAAGPAEHVLYNWNDEGDYLADPVIVQPLGADLLWLTNRFRYPNRFRFNRDQFGATVLAGVRRALELGVATENRPYGMGRSRVEHHWRDAERRLAARFAHLPPAALLAAPPTPWIMADPDTPDWLRLHADFPPAGEPYAEIFPIEVGIATPASRYLSLRILRVLSPHIRKNIPDWDITERELPPPTLLRLIESLDSLYHDTPRYSDAWLDFLDSRLTPPRDAGCTEAVFRSRLSLLVRDLTHHLGTVARTGSLLGLVCD